MDLFAQGVRDGHVTVYTDTPEVIVNKLREYNKEMSHCRSQKTILKYIEGALLIGLPLVLIALFLTYDYLVVKPLSAVLLFGGATVGGILCSIFKKPLPTALFMLLPLPLDKRAILLFLLAALMSAWHIYEDKRLREHRGYPSFLDIQISYSSNPDPMSLKSGLTEKGYLRIVFPYDSKPDDEFIITEPNVIKKGRRIKTGNSSGVSGYEFVPQEMGDTEIYARRSSPTLGNRYECYTLYVDYDMSIDYSSAEISADEFFDLKEELLMQEEAGSAANIE